MTKDVHNDQSTASAAGRRASWHHKPIASATTARVGDPIGSTFGGDGLPTASSATTPHTADAAELIEKPDTRAHAHTPQN